MKWLSNNFHESKITKVLIICYFKINKRDRKIYMQRKYRMSKFVYLRRKVAEKKFLFIPNDQVQVR